MQTRLDIITNIELVSIALLIAVAPFRQCLGYTQKGKTSMIWNTHRTQSRAT
jgi:hypothetical protein